MTRDQDLSWLDMTSVADLFDGRAVAVHGIRRGRRRELLRLPALLVRGSARRVRLGDGDAKSLSPDRKWVAAVVPSAPPRLMLLPTGAARPTSCRAARSASITTPGGCATACAC